MPYRWTYRLVLKTRYIYLYISNGKMWSLVNLLLALAMISVKQ